MGSCAQKIMPMNWEHYAYDSVNVMEIQGFTEVIQAFELLANLNSFIVIARFYMYILASMIKVLGTHTN